MRRLEMAMVKALTSLALAAVIGGGAVSAHHSFAVFFDDTKTIEISGSVTDFRFSNPHAIISLEVKNKAGMIEEWKAETNAVTLLKRRGWTKDSLKAGEVVTIDGWPSRDGANYMRKRTINIKKADGTVLGTPVRNQRAD
jgi:hypothetical protein